MTFNLKRTLRNLISVLIHKSCDVGFFNGLINKNNKVVINTDLMVVKNRPSNYVIAENSTTIIKKINEA
jgi:hypothetical protein